MSEPKKEGKAVTLKGGPLNGQTLTIGYLSTRLDICAPGDETVVLGQYLHDTNWTYTPITGRA